MEFICLLSSVPIRKEPISSSEKVSSLLFGEKCTLIEEAKDWVKIASNLDGYEGYISRERLNLFGDAHLEFSKRVFAPFLIAQSRNNQILIPCGSFIPKSLQFAFQEEMYYINENDNSPIDPIGLANRFINTPYNWGGRSIFGIDCSGLMQVIFSLNGFQLPRDAYQQVAIGQEIAYANRKAGDIAYFTNPKGRVTHVGILESPSSIIHAAGFVRKDKFDNKGIYRESIREYTHVLHCIKRL